MFLFESMTMKLTIKLYRFAELSWIAQQTASNLIPMQDPDATVDDFWFTSEGKPIDQDIVDTGIVCASSNEKEQAFDKVFDYLFRDEQRDFVTTPDDQHIYFQLLIVKHGLQQAQAIVRHLLGDL